MDSFESIYDTIRRITKPVILRIIEKSFYFLFTALAAVSFIVPFILNFEIVGSFTVGVLSIMYIIALYHLRFKINVNLGLTLHTLIFLLFSSFLFFDYELFEIGYILLGIAVVGLCVIIVLYGLGSTVFASRANEPPVNVAWAENGNEDNDDGQVLNQINLNHWRFNDDSNPAEGQNDVNPEVLMNDDVVDPQMQADDNVDPLIQNN